MNVCPVILFFLPPFISVLTGLISFFMTLTLYCLSMLPVFTDPRQLWESASGSNLCNSEAWQRPYLKKKKKKTNKKRRIPVSFSFPPSHKQLRSHQDSWRAGGGFGSQSPAEPHAGCPSCILCTSTAWGWGRALGRGPRCRASRPRSETLALLPTGAFRVNVGQREHENSIRDQDRSTSGSFFLMKPV